MLKVEVDAKKPDLLWSKCKKRKFQMYFFLISFDIAFIDLTFIILDT